MGIFTQQRNMDNGHGTSFFSLSITGSGMIVYGAYLKDDVDIPKASMQTAIFDTIAAMLAALAIMPAYFVWHRSR